MVDGIEEDVSEAGGEEEATGTGPCDHLPHRRGMPADGDWNDG